MLTVCVIYLQYITYSIHYIIVYTVSICYTPSYITWRVIHSIIYIHICAHSLSCVQLCARPWPVACQAPPSMEFFRPEPCSGLPFPTPGDLPDTGIELMSLASPTLAGRFFTTAPHGKPHNIYRYENIYMCVCVFNFVATLS